MKKYYTYQITELETLELIEFEETPHFDTKEDAIAFVKENGKILKGCETAIMEYEPDGNFGGEAVEIFRGGDK